MSERLWCTACGTVTRDMICDCNRWGINHEMHRDPQFVNYADAMQKTAHEQAQQINVALVVLKAYEQWEADLIMENKCWEGREVPQLTGELWDRLLELQAMRNRAIATLTPAQRSTEVG